MTIIEQVKKNIEEFDEKYTNMAYGNTWREGMEITPSMIKSHNKQAQISMIDAVIERLNNNFSENILNKEEHGQIFWDAENETDGWNNAIQDQIDYLKAERAIIEPSRVNKQSMWRCCIIENKIHEKKK